MPITRGSRRTLTTILALVLAIESVSAVGAAAAVNRAASVPSSEPAPSASQLVAGDTFSGAGHDAPVPSLTPAPVPVPTMPPEPVPWPEAMAPLDGAPSSISPVPTPTPTPKATPRPTPKATPKPTTTTARTATYSGTNHVWSSAFGLNHKVYAFSCSRSKYPGNVIYRWGCAGANNVYLFGHAANVMSGLHKAYVNKRLKAGQKVTYADGNGRVRTYAVRWWKVVAPDGDVEFAYAALAKPSMTLQTCLGRNNEWRLVVRLELVKG
jgi:hypothetical protein